MTNRVHRTNKYVANGEGDHNDFNMPEINSLFRYLLQVTLH